MTMPSASKSTASGRFITLEGGEGSGKSTLLSALAAAFERAQLQAIVTREPGGTTGAESIRRLLVEGASDAWDPMTETVLFMAARIDHVRKKITPALRAGSHVLCDRFSDSTLVYQGFGKGLGAEFIEMLHRFTLGEFAPDLTLILDIPPEAGLKRAHARRGAETRFESMDIGFHRQVREGFLTIAQKEPQRCAVIDALHAPEAVAADALRIIRQRLEVAL
jgi:dTMP kinase